MTGPDIGTMWDPEIDNHGGTVDNPGGTIIREAYQLHQLDDLPRCEWLVKRHIFRDQISCWYGPPGSHKSFLIFDMALHIAHGWDWHGDRVPKAAGVLYIAAEGASGFRDRRVAWEKHHGAPIGETLPFVLITRPVGMLKTEEGARSIVATAKEWERGFNVPIGLIVLDTLSQCSVGGDGNSDKDMGEYLSRCGLVRQLTGAHILSVHHAGKNAASGPRGSSVIAGNVDTLVYIGPPLAREGATITGTTDKARRLWLDKQKSGPDGWGRAFAPLSVHIGQDEDGEDVWSFVTVASDEAVTTKEADKKARGPARELTGYAKKALDALVDILAKHGTRHAGADGIPANAQTVPIEKWRQEFYDRTGPNDQGEQRRKEFTRAVHTLMERGEAVARYHGNKGNGTAWRTGQ